MIKDVRVSERLKERGVIENHRTFPKTKRIRVFGADTETVRGEPYSFQLVSQGEEVIERVSGATIFPRFMAWLMPRCEESESNIVFFHNLRFDLTILFSQNQAQMYDQYNDIKIERDGFVIRMLYGRVNMATIWEDLGGYQCTGDADLGKGRLRCGEVPKESAVHFQGEAYCGNPAHGKAKPKLKRRYGRSVKVIDSAAFCPPGAKSLAAALKIYGVPYKKMAKPDGLGQRVVWDAYFKDYALNDARAEEALGQAILDLHREYDVTPCVSLPQLSGRILRHHFFRQGESLKYPPEDCLKASELSYHAGKNGFYVPRGFYENLYEYDINSAFPKAMRDMPQLVKGEYRHVARYRKNVMGIYRISGRRLSLTGLGKYPLVFDHAFKPVPQGAFLDLWITGYELEVLKESPDYQVRVQEGWVWIPDPAYTHSPLTEFVERFWHLKSTAPKGPKRDTYKNIMNSLYGKFAACVEKRPTVETAYGDVCYDGVWNEVDLMSAVNEKYYVAGALYHPFIATQITGQVRAVLFRLEERGRSLHSATDSIKSRLDLPTSEALGGIKKEVFGNCYLFRNKLYLHFAQDTRLCGHDLDKGWLYVSDADQKRLPEVGAAHETGYRYDKGEDRAFGKIFDRDQHLCKYGRHGFKGSTFELFAERHRIIKEGYFQYHYEHMTSLREAIRRGETVSDMVEREERLTLA